MAITLIEHGNNSDQTARSYKIKIYAALGRVGTWNKLNKQLKHVLISPNRSYLWMHHCLYLQTANSLQLLTSSHNSQLHALFSPKFTVLSHILHNSYSQLIT